MSEKENRLGLRPGRSRLSRRLLLQYVASMAAFLLGSVVAYVLARWVCRLFVWQPYNALYQLLKLLEYYTPVWGTAVLLLGFALISYRYMIKPLRYLDEVIDASAQLTQTEGEQIVLSSPLQDVENQWNALRQRSRESALQAKREEQRKNDLIVYLAHDLKTPLTSVIGYLTLLRDEKDISREQRARFTGIALDKALRLEELINEFFEITRFNLTQLSLKPQTLNLTRMLEQITFEFMPEMADKGLSWDLKLTPFTQVICDPDKLERMVDNLLRNAIHYCYPNTAIEVSLQRKQEWVVLAVTNRGRTIPQDNLGRVFDQFFRLDASRGSASGGAGLGLAIAKEIAQLHRGEIWAQSADESVSFFVKLPKNYQTLL